MRDFKELQVWQKAHRFALEVYQHTRGFPAEEREQVFKRFYRLLGQGDESGSGLGLAIVKEICQAHGGTVTLDAGPGGRGLLVRIGLPVAAEISA